VRGIISKFKTLLTLSVEIYETENGNLVASADPVRSENAAELLMKTAAACADMYKTFTGSQSPVAQGPAPKAAVTYALAAAAVPVGGGTVSRNPDQAYYAPGTSVNVMATPAKEYKFAGWSGDAAGTANLVTLKMDGDKALTATFYRKPEPRPQQSAPPVKPAAGLVQEPTGKKRHTLAAAGLDVLGAGLLLYGYGRDFNVRNNNGVHLWTAAENSAKQRDVAYTVGAVILLSGISVHIFF